MVQRGEGNTCSRQEQWRECEAIVAWQCCASGQLWTICRALLSRSGRQRSDGLFPGGCLVGKPDNQALAGTVRLVEGRGKRAIPFWERSGGALLSTALAGAVGGNILDDQLRRPDGLRDGLNRGAVERQRSRRWRRAVSRTSLGAYRQSLGCAIGWF